VTSRAPTSAAAAASSLCTPNGRAPRARRARSVRPRRRAHRGARGQGEDAHQAAERVEPPRSTSARTNSRRWAPGTARKGPSRWPGDLGATPGRAARRGADPGQGGLQGVEGCGHDGRAPGRNALGQQGGVQRVPVRARGAGTSMSPIPLTWRSTKPGTSTTSGSSCRGPHLDDQSVFHHHLGVGDRSGGRHDGGGPDDLGVRGARRGAGRSWRQIGRFVSCARESYGIAVLIPRCRCHPTATSPWAWSASTSPSRDDGVADARG